MISAKLECGDDLAHLSELDPKLWTALAAPIDGLRFDRRTLEFIDSDHDGRIRAPEVLAAVKWTLERVDSADSLFAPDASLSAALADVVKRQTDLAAAAPSAADLAALKAWEDAPKSDAAILPLGESTAVANDALAAVEEPVDVFFAVPDDLPLVTEEPDKSLPISDRLNPKWADALRKFALVAAPLLKRERVDVLTRSDWLAAKSALAPYRAWLAAKPVMAADAKEKLEEEEKLLRFRLHLVDFLRNFVNMADLYDSSRGSAAQTGTLYLDSRAFTLCFHVADEAAHSAVAGRSECCVVYLKLTRPAAAPRSVCAVVTAGGVSTLYAGRNGVFCDRDGLDWDAVVTKVVEAQVSLREAFWAPWRKLADTVAAQVKKFVGDRQTAATAGVAKVAEAPAKDAGSSAALASSVAALGVGVGMMGAAFAGLIGLVAGLPWWKTAGAVVAVILAVSVPSVVLTWFKLRRRDLGAIFNAGGWAINRPLRFSLALARTFTRTASPRRRVPRPLVVALFALAAAALGVSAMRSAQVGPFAPKSSVSFRDGACGRVAVLSAPGGRCEVSLVGGVVLSWIPAGGDETLFRPDAMNLGPDAEWVHGGIPACWPWFGTHGGDGKRIHGFLRNFVLDVRSSRAADDFAELVLGLSDNAETRKLWPHAFDVRLVVRVGEKLSLALTTTNRDSAPLAVTEGFHPYFLVSERDNAVVRGLNGCAYYTDRIVNPKWWIGDLPVTRALDDVFWVRDDKLALADVGFKRVFDLSYSGNRRVVVWNPGPEERKNRNLAKDDWRKFVCVEPATIPGEDATVVAPGQSHTISATFQVNRM